MAIVVGLLVVLLIGIGVAEKITPLKEPRANGPAIEKIPLGPRDTDQDGLLDEEESTGWRTRDGSVHRTDPRRPDTDNDGLTDGEEAGRSSKNSAGNLIYAGRSDPTLADTDHDGLGDGIETGEPGSDRAVRSAYYAVSNPLVADSDADGIGDGDEYLLDMDPLLVDTDKDGLLDPMELKFGSDPTLRNADGDSYTDKQEYARRSNPLSYDLTGKQKLAASGGGLAYGSCHKCALKRGLRIEQVESAEYLAGYFVSGLVGLGDLRDLVLSIWERQFLEGGLAALDLIPYIGDSFSAVVILTKFAKRGDRAEQAVRAVTDKLPLSKSDKRKVLQRLPSRAGKLPRELTGGPKNSAVYKCGKDYVGITKNMALRQAQHRAIGRTCEPMRGLGNLSRGEARAIEQACIDLGRGVLQNKRNSINPNLPYKGAAVAFGHARLRKVGETCPVIAPRPLADLPVSTVAL